MLSYTNPANICLGLWPNPIPIEGQDNTAIKKYKIIEFGCRALQMALHLHTAYKCKFLAKRILLFLNLLPHCLSFVSRVFSNKEIARLGDKWALFAMIINSIALMIIKMPATSLRNLVAYGACSVLCYKLASRSLVLLNPNEKNYYDALEKAVDRDDYERMDVLLKTGIKGEALGPYKLPLPHYAVSQGKTQMIKHLIEKDPEVLHQLDASNCTLLHWAAWSGNEECVSYLLEKGIDKEKIGGTHELTTLLSAAGASQANTMALLLKNGAQKDAVDKDGSNALHYVFGNRSNPERKLACLNVLAAANVNMNAKNKNGKTALDFAIESHLHDFIQPLLSKGALPIDSWSDPVKRKEYEDKLKELKLAADWERKAIRAIRKSHQDVAAKEIERLKNLGFLTPLVGIKIDQGLAELSLTHKKDTAYMMLGRVLEIKSIFSETHHVFTHAQCMNLMIISILVKEMFKKQMALDPTAEFVDLSNFKYLRHISEDVDVSLKKPLLDEPQNVYDYLKKFGVITGRIDDDPKVGKNLLSVDGYVYNSGKAAIHYLLTNSNVKASLNVNIIENILKSFRPDVSAEVIKKYSKELCGLKPTANAPCGNLFVICVPKSISDAIQYRSHPGGIPCNCHAIKRDHKGPLNDKEVQERLKMHTEILEKLQKDVLDDTTKCPAYGSPQYRLYTPMLKPEYGVRIFRLSPIHKKQRNEYKDMIRAIITKFFAEP